MEFEKYNPTKHGEPSRKTKQSWVTPEMKTAVAKQPIVLTKPADRADMAFRNSLYSAFKHAGLLVGIQKLSDDRYKVEAKPRLTATAE